MRGLSRQYQVAVLFLMSIAAGCGKPSTRPASPVNATPTASTLSYQWQAKRLDFRFELSQDLKITTPGTQIDSYLRVNQAYSLSPKPRSDTQGTTIQMRFLDQQVSVLEGDIEGTFDSSSPDPPPSRAGVMLGSSFGRIKGEQITLQLTADHRIESVEGLGSILKKMTQGAHPNIESIIFSIYDEDRIRQLIYLTQLPAGELSNGHAWPIQESRQFGLLGRTQMDGTAKLHGLKERDGRPLYQIEISGTAKQAAGVESSSSHPYVLSDGTFKGRAWFDPDLGQYSDTVLNYDLNVLPNSQPHTSNPANVQRIRVIQKYTTKLLNVISQEDSEP